MRRIESAAPGNRLSDAVRARARVWRGATLALSCLLAASTGTGQEVRGRVVQPSGGGAAGVLVNLVGQGGDVLTHTVTDSEGRFRFEYAGEGSRLSAAPIGRASVAVALPESGQEALIELGSDRLDMSRIRAGAQNRCERDPATTSAAGQLLAEIRKALTVEAWARAGHRFNYDVFQYERLMGPGDRIDEERGRKIDALDTSPARSRPPAELAAEGYARSTPRGEVLFAPDGDVLLSNEFTGSRCFRVELEPAGSRRLGLAFGPAETGSVDIEGVIWVDPSSAELRSVEFSYTGLTTDVARRPRGGLEFRRLPDGLFTVGRWWLRSPLPRDAGAGYREEGVETVRVVYADGGSAAVMARARLLGLVNDSMDMPVPGARVHLIGTPYEATTNTEGRFLIPELPPGHYRMTIAAPDRPNSTLGTQDVSLTPDLTTQVELKMVAVPDPASATSFSALDSIRWVLRSVGLRTTARLDSLITAGMVDTEPSRLIGRVFDRATGRAIQGAEVRLSGTEYSAVTSADGRFVIGDVAPGRYVVGARMLGYSSRADTISLPPGLVIDADVALATQPIELEPIAVSVHSRWLDSNGFFERRMSGLAGAFLTRREIEEKKPSLLTDLLRDVPGVMMSTDEVGKSTVRMRRMTTMTGLQAQEEGSRGCTPGVYYDGIPLNAGFDRLHNIPIPFIDGVEVYVGAATPIQYKHPCGVILIWTRRPR